MTNTLQTLSKHFLNPALEKVLKGRYEHIHVTSAKGGSQSWGDMLVITELEYEFGLLVSKPCYSFKLLLAPLEVQADIYVSMDRGYNFSQEQYF